MAMDPSGKLIIGYERVSSPATFRGVDAARGTEMEPPFAAAGKAEVDRACALADSAFDTYRGLDIEARARFLECCADKIVALGDALIVRAERESGLPRARLEGERGRTVGQLRLFAATVRKGDWLGLRIDPALPDRAPLPRPDLRQRKIPLGPVAVFGASNFPLAFSAAGGDTASALAAGCPVIVKAHPAHPGTSELAAGAIRDAAEECGVPEGVFSHLSGPSNELGASLVNDPRIKAVGFTGSRAGGLALMKLAAARPERIPVYAEMSSINPVLLMPGALKTRADALGQAFAASLTMGTGQFCTNPGLVLALESSDLDRFAASATEALSKIAAGQMLTRGIRANYCNGVARLKSHAKVSHLGSGLEAGEGTFGTAALFQVSARDFLADTALGEEVFGPSSLVVRCHDIDELIAVLHGLEGQLTATLHMEADDHGDARQLLPLLERKVGRILVNGWPTGVEVSPAMVHGGPFPATSDSRSTSVGTLAIDRFLRPVCYQNMPGDLLPPELTDGNPQRFRRLFDGNY
ncbi:MAG TPA: aldehyde dehydrogenase (NADP(+)) [Rhizomicrobium sp.]|jgi:NADP-dependent aldehyde dehydrogenase